MLNLQNKWDGEKLKLQQQEVKAFFRNLILILSVAIISAVGFIWLEMRNVFIFCFMALLPGITALLWDKKPGKFASKTVFAFNITGMSPYIVAIASSGSPDVTAYNTLQDLYAWVLIYSFAALGMGILYLIPQITLVILEIRSKYMVKKMKRFQQDLVDEWGEDGKK